jgi:diguanylate cyclase (GGDEF)-like protein
MELFAKLTATFPGRAMSAVRNVTAISRRSFAAARSFGRRLGSVGAALPRKWLLTAAAAALAAGIEFTFALVRAVVVRHGGNGAWISDEGRWVDACVAFSSLVTLMPLGFALGRSEDAMLMGANTDPLTGVANRRPLQLRLKDDRRAATQPGPATLLLIDVDHLKQVNDRHGHSVGDAAIRLVADVLRQTCRRTDLVARIGGDEFAVYASGTSATHALDLAERVRTQLAEKRVEIEGGNIPVSISVGLAEFDPMGARRPEEIFEAADRALYRAKAAGRDRVVTASVEPRSEPPVAPSAAVNVLLATLQAGGALAYAANSVYWDLTFAPGLGLGSKSSADPVSPGGQVATPSDVSTTNRAGRSARGRRAPRTRGPKHAAESEEKSHP